MGDFSQPNSSKIPRTYIFALFTAISLLIIFQDSQTTDHSQLQSQQQQLILLHEKMNRMVNQHANQLNQLKEKILSLNLNILQLEDRQTKMTAAHKELIQKLKEAEKQIAECNQQQNNLNIKMGYINQEVSSLRIQLAQLSNSHRHPDPSSGRSHHHHHHHHHPRHH